MWLELRLAAVLGLRYEVFPTRAVLGQMDHFLGVNSQQSQEMGMPQVSLVIPIASGKGSGFLSSEKQTELDFFSFSLILSRIHL